MAYQAGDTILDDEYNTFVNSSSSPFGYNHFAGTGVGAYGLGQTHIATVTGGATTITASHWNTLFTAMDNIGNHTNAAGLTLRSQVSAGDTIAIKAAVEADLATLAASVAGGCVNAEAIQESAELVSSASGTRWNGNHTVEQKITFSNNNDLRHFFNAGGKMRIKITRTGDGGSSATSKDSSMDELITGLGNFDLGAQVSTRSGTTETLTDGLANGVADLSSTYTQILLLTQDSGTYTSMTLKIEAAVNNTDYTDATEVTIRTTLTDADGTDGEYTDGNTDTVDQYAEFIGTTDVALHTMNPTTDQGLASVASISGSNEVSNNGGV
jgi:hypothetical protein